MTPWTLLGGQVIEAHDPDLCKGAACAVHAPSAHVMSEFRQHWRNDRSVMERICPHGIGHPDPDHIRHIREWSGAAVARVESVHGCDGCCKAKP